MNEPAKTDYRAKYEQLLDEFTSLEANEQLQQTLLRSLMNRVLFAVDKAYPTLAKESQALRTLVRQVGDVPLPITRIQPGIERLAESIWAIEAGDLTPGREESLSKEEVAERVDVRDFLPLLLERVAFTESMEGRREKLLAILDDPKDKTLNSILIDRAATLINDMRRALENEKNELTDFLRQLTEALSEIDQHTLANLGDVETQRKAQEAPGPRRDRAGIAYRSHRVGYDRSGGTQAGRASAGGADQRADRHVPQDRR